MKRNKLRGVYFAFFFVSSLQLVRGFISVPSLPTGSISSINLELSPARKWKASNIIPKSKNYNHDGNDAPVNIEEESDKALSAVKSCVKVAALSAVLDLSIGGVRYLKERHLVGGEVLSNIVPTIWKLGFAFNLWKASGLYVSLEKEQDIDKVSQRMEQIVSTMTWVWRSSALMITLLTVVDLSKAWQRAERGLQGGILAVLLVAVTVTFYTNAKETKNLAAAAFNNNKSKESWFQRGLVTVRSMLLCATVLWLEAAVVPIGALRSYRKSGWRGAVFGLLDMPTPIITAALLRTLRKSVLKALSDLIREDNKRLEIDPQTEIELSLAQQEFYGKVKETISVETIVKVVFTISHLKVVSSFLGGIMGKS